MSQLPSSIGLPQEMSYQLDFSIPPDAKSFSAKIQPSNISSVTASFTPAITAGTAFPDQPFPSQNVIFDIPCGQSPSTFLDNRFSTINFTMTVSVPTLNSGTTGKFTDAYLRSSAASWFDRMYIIGQNGSQIEDISEFGLLNDTMVALQMNNSVRHGLANQYGFDVNTATVASQGHKIPCLSPGAGLPAAGLIESHSYSFPLMSGIVGCLADKFLNIGRTSRLQLVLQTTSTIPITGGVNTAFVGSAPTITVTLSNFSLQLEYIDIGINALQMLDQTLVDNKAYIHGTTFRTSSTSIAASAGSQTALIGVRASSVKSIFARFSQGGTPSTTNSLSGKYDSVNPCINSINFSIGGLKYPQSAINPLYSPAQAFRETQCAIGSFNNSSFQSCIIPSAYCKLAAGTAITGGLLAENTKGATQDYNWSQGTTQNSLAQFIFGENLEICAKRSLLSGLNCTSAPIFCEMNLAGSPANICTMYAQVWCDHVIIHDVKTGDISIRI